MKLTLSWLKDHLDTDASLDDIVSKLTMIGLEVERVEVETQMRHYKKTDDCNHCSHC